MALTDCIKCWMTPCECGHEYKDWTPKRKMELATAVMGETIYTKKMMLSFAEHLMISLVSENPESIEPRVQAKGLASETSDIPEISGSDINRIKRILDRHRD